VSPDSTEAAVAALRTVGPARRWRIATTNGITASGYLPAWAYEDPSASDIDPRRLDVTLANVVHFYQFEDVIEPLVGPDDGLDGEGNVMTYFCEVAWHPFADASAPDDPLHPVLNIQVSGGETTRCADPVELVAFIARLRAHIEYLDLHVLPVFTAIREDWKVHHREAIKPVI
jgi:hypothetical protein